MKRLLGGIVLSTIVALTLVVGLSPAKSSEAASNITVTVNGCNAEVKWKPSQFASTQAVAWGRLHSTSSGLLSISTTSFTIRGLQPGTYAVRVIQTSSSGYQWSDDGPKLTITCNPAFPY